MHFRRARYACTGAKVRSTIVVGHGFIMLARGGDPAAALSRDDHAFWNGIGGRIVRVGEATAVGGLTDTEAQYTRLMDEHECDVLIKRPDYYMFGACSFAQLPSAMADMRAQLRAHG